MNSKRENILSTISAENFIGRTEETDFILHHAKEEERELRGLLVLSAPKLGASELLRQIYDRLFYEQPEKIPFYFRLKKSDKTAKNAALRFLQTFLLQTVAFRRNDKKILDASPDVCEISQLAQPSDGYWIDRLIETCQSKSKLNNYSTFIKNCLSAPLRAAANEAKVFVMIDDVHESLHLENGDLFLEILREVFSHSNTNFVIAGRRRFVFDEFYSGNFKTLEIKPLSLSDAGFLAENLAKTFSIKINDQTRDLLAEQLKGNPLFIKSVFEAANVSSLESYHTVEKIYADEIFGGKIGNYFDEIFNEIAPDIETDQDILGLLYDALTVETGKMPLESWQNRSGLKGGEFYGAIQLLNIHEFIRVSSNQIEAMSENQALTDYITARFRLEILAENRALVIAEMLSDFLKRAPRLMAKFYRRTSAIGLRELLAVFDYQEIPAALLDYSQFKNDLKGASNAEILKFLANDENKIHLPQVAFAAHTVAFYPSIEQFVEKERSAVAFGFLEPNYTDENQIVWVAAEIDSKLEATAELAAFWCDRLEMVALMCNFLKFKVWLVAPEGFSPEASEVLRKRNAYGSSKKQIELLIEYLGAEITISEKVNPNEFEMVVPMGEDTELIAAHAVEEVARRYNFPSKAINQIKTALVEACINASEHSHSPDRKIYQKIAFEDDRIIITVSNRGLRLQDKNAEQINPDEGRRGWGLKLMQKLMDEVKFEQVDDGTRISMVKYLV